MRSCTNVIRFLIVLIFPTISSPVQLGKIVNATFSIDSFVSFSTLANRSCEQCLCQMLTNPRLISAVSCEINRSMCYFLFSNSTALIQPNETSSIYMINTNWTRQNSSIKTILWKFDQNFHGIPINNPTFQSPGIHGSGTCLYLNGSAQQSVTIVSPPFLNMSYTSFTISMWLNINSYNNGSTLVDSDNVIFAQNDQLTSFRSLHLILRRGKPYFGFYDSDAASPSTLQIHRWTHLSFVYNYPLRQQIICINGVLNINGVARNPYQGNSGNITIGTGVVAAPNNFWDGCLDQITFDSYAKTASEILDDATLNIFYTFEENLFDQGPLGNHGNGTNIFFTTSGRIGKAANFSMNPSLITTKYLIPISSSNQSFTFALWINPSQSPAQGILIQLSTDRTDVLWTIPMLGFTNTGYITSQLCSTTDMITVSGPLINANSWTHLAVTYNPTGNFTLWINGTIFRSTPSTFDYYSSVASPLVATIGSSTIIPSFTCSSYLISLGQYVGLIDQFQIYSRVLSSNEILALINT